MIRRVTVAGFALACAAATPVLVMAADWQLVGTSTFTTTSSWMKDYKRIFFNSIVVDNAGNVYTTAQYGNGITPGTNDSGITIYLAAGGQVDVDLGTLANPLDATYGFKGAVTKLVVAGDGLVYGLQNWVQIHWGDNVGVPNRIIQITPAGNVTQIFTAGSPPANNKRLSGMTVGSDGHVYWTTAGNGSDVINDKWHYFWRYNVDTQQVQESPRNTVYGDGFNTASRMFNLEYVGTTASSIGNIDSFAAMFTSSDWNPFAMGWDKINGDASNNWYNRRNAINGSANPGWRDYVTATAYDPQRKKLWVGGRGSGGGSPWGQDGGGGSIQIVDSNYVMQGNKPSGSRQTWRFNTSAPAVGISGRVRFTAMGDTYNASYMMRAAATTSTPVAAIKAVYKTPTTYGLELWDVAATETKRADLPGDFNLNQWYDIRLFVDSGSDQVAVYVDGVQITGSPFTNFNIAAATTGQVACGARIAAAGDATTATLQADWLLYTAGVYTGAPTAAPTAQSIPNGGTLGAYLDGNVLPENWKRSNVMTRWEGNSTATALYNGVGLPGVNPDPMPGIVRNVNWHTNGNAPDSSNVSNGGMYWVAALAVNPCDGSAWMAWGAQENNDSPGFYKSFGDWDSLGHVYSIGENDIGPVPVALGGNSADQGAPLAAHTSQVVGLTFADRKAYALVADLSGATASFKTYVADADAGCCPVVPFDSNNDGDVDMDDFGAFQACYSGPANAAAECRCFDRHPAAGNSKIDENDFVKFLQCQTRSEVLQVNEACAN